MSLGDLWNTLEQQPVPDRPGMLMRSAHAGATCAVLAALLLPGAERSLLIRLPETEAQALVIAGLTPAIELSLHDDRGAHPGQASVMLRARDPRHRDLFMHIGDDLVDQLRREPTRPVQVLLQRIELWRDFLRRRDETLTEPRLRGLFGEVWFLTERLLPRTATHHRVAALAAWTGPLGARRDFNLGEASLDMKTGVPGSTAVQIASIQQLSPAPGTQLYLGHLTLKRDAAGQTLPELIDRLRSTLDTGARELLDARLLQAGYIDADRNQAPVSDLRLIAEQFDTYTITPGFPALTPENLPPAVIACSYTLDLSTCGEFRVDPGQIPGIGERHRSLHEQ